MVRDVMVQMSLEYEKIEVPWPHQQRKEVYKVSGQTAVPVLVDGDVILDDEYEIIDYLKKTYPVNS
jgi:glutathione S-transferase